MVVRINADLQQLILLIHVFSIQNLKGYVTEIIFFITFDLWIYLKDILKCDFQKILSNTVRT